MHEVNTALGETPVVLTHYQTFRWPDTFCFGLQQFSQRKHNSRSVFAETPVVYIPTTRPCPITGPRYVSVAKASWWEAVPQLTAQTAHRCAEDENAMCHNYQIIQWCKAWMDEWKYLCECCKMYKPKSNYKNLEAVRRCWGCLAK